MKIALLLGSFNPVHIGHVELAKYVLDNRLAERVWCVVSPQNPLKSESEVGFDQRFEMVKLAFDELENVEVTDIENHLARPCYTYNTIVELKKLHPNDEFFILCGSDIFAQLSRWHRSDELIELVDFKVYPRGGGDFSPEFSNAHLLNVSSSEIRAQLNKTMLPECVYGYVLQHKLYFQAWDFEQFYDLGVHLYSCANFGGALNALNKAIELKSDYEPASQMITLVQDILAYRNTDMYNP